MASYDFRILLETVEGNFSSYMTSSFIDTDVELVLSSSEAYHRITSSVSCSYQNTTFFSSSLQPDGTFTSGSGETITLGNYIGDYRRVSNQLSRLERNPGTFMEDYNVAGNSSFLNVSDIAHWNQVIYGKHGYGNANLIDFIGAESPDGGIATERGYLTNVAIGVVPQPPLASQVPELTTFKFNNLLSASLSGSTESGSISFTAILDDNYDRLLRYKFIGEKVCNVLGLPSNKWVYVDQFRLPSDNEANYLEANVKAGSLHISDSLSFSNNATITSDVPIAIVTGSDTHIKFIDEGGTGSIGISMGYDNESDRFELTSDGNAGMTIDGVASLTATHITASGNISASGIIYGKQRYYTHHAFEVAGTANSFVPINHEREHPSNTYYHRWIAPYDGRLVKTLARGAVASNVSRVSFATASNGTEDSVLVADTTIVVDMDTADTSYEFVMSESLCSFNKGDALSLMFSSSNASTGELNLTGVWEYVVND